MRFLLALLLTASCATAYRPAKPLPGDVNHDGVVNDTDSDLVLQFVVGALDSTALDLALADISGDGTVTAYDAALIDGIINSTVSVTSGSLKMRLADIKRMYTR